MPFLCVFGGFWCLSVASSARSLPLHCYILIGLRWAVQKEQKASKAGVWTAVVYSFSHFLLWGYTHVFWGDLEHARQIICKVFGWIQKEEKEEYLQNQNWIWIKCIPIVRWTGEAAVMHWTNSKLTRTHTHTCTQTHICSACSHTHNPTHHQKTHTHTCMNTQTHTLRNKPRWHSKSMDTQTRAHTHALIHSYVSKSNLSHGWTQERHGNDLGRRRGMYATPSTMRRGFRTSMFSENQVSQENKTGT